MKWQIKNKVANNKVSIAIAIISAFSGGAITKCAEAFIMVSNEVQEWVQSKPVKSKPTSEGGIDYEIKYEEKFGKTKAQEIK